MEAGVEAGDYNRASPASLHLESRLRPLLFYRRDCSTVDVVQAEQLHVDGLAQEMRGAAGSETLHLRIHVIGFTAGSAASAKLLQLKMAKTITAACIAQLSSEMDGKWGQRIFPSASTRRRFKRECSLPPFCFAETG